MTERRDITEISYYLCNFNLSIFIFVDCKIYQIIIIINFLTEKFKYWGYLIKTMLLVMGSVLRNTIYVIRNN